MKHIFFLRHAKSDWSIACEDHERSLKKRGRRDAERLGIFLTRQKTCFGRIYCSSATRAQQTLHYLLKASQQKSWPEIYYDRRLYDADPKNWLTILAQTPETIDSILCVGHNPELQTLILSSQTEKKIRLRNDKPVPTATLATCEYDGTWQQLTAPQQLFLRQITYPRELPRLFPYPEPNSPDTRERPAYYYHQSAILPWRQGKKDWQVLLVGSEKKQHPMIPKGIIEPFMSARDSAIKEACEEAGVMGKTSKIPIAHYTYQKWGAICNVAVFLMKVTKVCPVSQWEESGRGRIWLDWQIAKNQVRQPEVSQLIARLPQFLIKL